MFSTQIGRGWWVMAKYIRVIMADYICISVDNDNSLSLLYFMFNSFIKYILVEGLASCHELANIGNPLLSQQAALFLT